MIVVARIFAAAAAGRAASDSIDGRVAYRRDRRPRQTRRVSAARRRRSRGIDPAIGAAVFVGRSFRRIRS